MTGEPGDDEAAWRDLVAQFAAPAVSDGTAPWPVREELPPPAQPPLDGEDAGRLTGGAPAGRPCPGQAGEGTQSPAGQAGQRERQGPGPEPGASPPPPHIRVIRPALPGPPPTGDDDDHYVPPPPPPMPRLDPVSKGAWLALFGGPLYLLAASMLGWTISGWAAFGAVAAFVGGFAALVIRMGDRPPGDSGPDNGAVV